MEKFHSCAFCCQCCIAAADTPGERKTVGSFENAFSHRCRDRAVYDRIFIVPERRSNDRGCCDVADETAREDTVAATNYEKSVFPVAPGDADSRREESVGSKSPAGAPISEADTQSPFVAAATNRATG